MYLVITLNQLKKRRKAMSRRNLFSDNTQRRKLFSSEVEESQLVEKELICQDCGYHMKSTGSNTQLFCPKCGGSRFNYTQKVFSPEGTPEPVPEKTFSVRRVLFESEEDFQKAFSETSDPLELKLKKFSGMTIDSDLFEKEFSDIATSEELQERGFAELEGEDKIRINSDAFFQSRLFSKLTLTITKTLELDPEVCCCDHKEGIIDNLENENRLNPKCIVLLKKAHGIPLVKDGEAWAHDSGIINDLPIEFGGERKPISDFKNTIEERYPDAPEDIIDLLKRKGIINIDGDHVEINK